MNFLKYFKKLKAGIIVFPGTNCDRDTKIALDGAGFNTDYIFHNCTNLEGYDLIVLPGGFSFGDYIRAGRLAKLSPVVFALKKYVKSKCGFTLGICNGFQILCEAGLLPGALIENASTRFISRDEILVLEKTREEITIPIAHKEGCFYADDADLRRIEENKMVFLFSVWTGFDCYDTVSYAREGIWLCGIRPSSGRGRAYGLPRGLEICDFI